MLRSKLLFVVCYKPPSQSKTINVFSTKYDNILFIRNFNLTIENKHLEKLLNVLNLKSLISPRHVFSPQILRALI